MSKNNPNNKLFQETILVHLDSAYNYARWLCRDAHDAEDLTQEAFTRAFTAFKSFKHANPKSWLLTIVRHTFLNLKQKEQRQGDVIYLDATFQHENILNELSDPVTPEKNLLRQHESELIHKAINELTTEFREIIVLRELEGFSYNEIALITDCALGTVMSRLSRARNQLKSILTSVTGKSEHSENKA